MSSNVTFKLIDLLPTYGVFIEFVKDIPLTVDNLTQAYHLLFYNSFKRKYGVLNINYELPYHFICEFSNLYQEHFNQFLSAKKIIDITYSLTPNDFQEISASIVNFAKNPNYEVTNPDTLLNYIGEQSYNKLTSNKLKAYLDAIRGLPELNVLSFINKFEYLFQQIYTHENYHYRKEEIL